MKKLKFYIIIVLITSFAFNQDQNFDKSIKDTEDQISMLKASINSGNNEVEKLKTQSKKTKDIIELTRKNIQNSNALINAYDKKIGLYNKQLVNLENAIIRNNQSIYDIKNLMKQDQSVFIKIEIMTFQIISLIPKVFRR